MSKMTVTIKIKWVPGYHPSLGYTGEAAQTTFIYDFDGETTLQAICDEVYRATNLQVGAMWDIINLVAPRNRPHTSISVFNGPIVNGEMTSYGDTVSINGIEFECKEFGWEMVRA